jgi:GWxTD domain-containing protein
MDTEDIKQRENGAVAKLPKSARFWLTEDVVYIISREERCAFLHLATDLDRDHFIELFWSSRAPDPKSLDNSFKREHYERIAFANEKYGDQFPGWKTDRGHVLVKFGPPDLNESHRAANKTGRPPEEGSETVQYSREVWHYNHIQGVGENVEFEFVDPSETGEYHLTAPPEMKEELILIPPYDTGRTLLGGRPIQLTSSIELYIGPAPTPLVQFKDLESMVVSRIIRNQVQFDHRIEFAKATHATTLTKIVVNLSSHKQVSAKNNASSAIEFEVFGRVSRPSGWVMDTFERKISFERKETSGQSHQDCQFEVAIAPGTYRLAIVVKNTANGETGALYTGIAVPTYEKLDVKK